MAKNLVIVESPAKAKTIEKYLGKDFKVLSSVGHIRGIIKKPKKDEVAIDVNNGFKTTYEIDPEKKKIITELKKAIKEADTVWLATDEDREGEAIAWHLCEVLKLDVKTTKRIVFHEITKEAIKKAIENPRTIDMKLVKAQQARQILDRLVGFDLSPVVWQKVPGGKSAGRVQSPAVRLVVEKEREIDNFNNSSDYKVTALFNPKNNSSEEIKAELEKRLENKEVATNFLEQIKDANFKVADTSNTPGKRSPSAPFTTSTLQQDASSKLGYSTKTTMSTAQNLYQKGMITYMRTDSVNLSDQAINSAKTYIINTYGEKYSKVRKYKTKSASAQEAHEAIRPTDMTLEKLPSGFTSYDQKIYSLIRNRTLASQMADALIDKTTIKISNDKQKEKFIAKGEVITFDGFLKVYGTAKNEILPKVSVEDPLSLIEAIGRETYQRPPARYTEGSLVKKLEELGIGRPSTYASILGTIQARDYVNKGQSEGTEREVNQLTLKDHEIKDEMVTEKTGADKGKLIPTSIGIVISDFLRDYFKDIVDYDFTAKVEAEFDQIANGKLDRNKMLEAFYTPFSELIKKSGGIDRTKVSQTREVGKDPKTGEPIYARFSRYGAVLQKGELSKDKKPQFAPMPAGAKIETVTLDEALEMFKLPRILGTTKDGDEIKANIGRFGPYIQIGKLFVSIKPLDPFTITLTEALELYDKKLKAEAEKNIADLGEGIKVLNGRFGPYVTNGKKNCKIPKDKDPKTVTLDEALELLETKSTPKKSTKKSTKSTK